jgi:hypothetical protein
MNDSLPALLRGIGSTIIVVAAVVATFFAWPADGQSVAEEVVTNPWFDLFGLLGTATISISFYVDWMQKRPRKNGQP